jgi:hypothetical protein
MRGVNKVVLIDCYSGPVGPTSMINTAYGACVPAEGAPRN